jgi:hypothetical protein
MSLSDARIQELKQMGAGRLLKRACAIHAQLKKNIKPDPEVIDLPLMMLAAELHEFYYCHVPAAHFNHYVKTVHDFLGHPNWLCGRPGVPYVECK